MTPWVPGLVSGTAGRGSTPGKHRLPRVLGVCTSFHRYSVVRAPVCPLRSSMGSPPWGSPCRHVGRSSAPCTPPRLLTVPAGGRSVASIAAVNIFPSWQEVAGSVSTWVSVSQAGRGTPWHTSRSVPRPLANRPSQSPPYLWDTERCWPHPTHTPPSVTQDSHPWSQAESTGTWTPGRMGRRLGVDRRGGWWRGVGVA